MIRERLRSWLFPRPPDGGRGTAQHRRYSGAATRAASEPFLGPLSEPVEYTRHSHGLEQFFAWMRGRTALNVLDLGQVNQVNVSFLTDLGHKLYSEDFWLALEAAFGDGDFLANQADPERVRAFLSETLRFPDDHFDAVLLCDVLECLSRPVLLPMMERLAAAVRPQGTLLAFFHADEKAETVPAFSFRIVDDRNLFLSYRRRRRRAQAFNNRGIEKLFAQFRSLKFFLTRDHLREVIVTR